MMWGFTYPRCRSFVDTVLGDGVNAVAGVRELDGAAAIVTGSTQGLGEATARLFAQRGAAGLVICGRNGEKGRAVAADLADMGTKTIFVRADLAQIDDVRAVVAKTDATFGRVDSLINCAGYTQRGTILDTSPELFDQMFAVNVRAPFFLTQDAVPAHPEAFEELLTEQGLSLDLEAGVISARGGTLHDAQSLGYPIEYLMVTDRGRTHEALFVMKAQPSVLDACFRALGLVPGHSMRWVMSDPQPPREAVEAGEASPWEAVPGSPSEVAGRPLANARSPPRSSSRRKC